MMLTSEQVNQRIDEFAQQLYEEISGENFSQLFTPAIGSIFFRELIRKTNNFGYTTWLGQPIWQNVLDLWTIQETIAEVRPRLLIECGTYHGGSSLFYANLFDLMG